jgi:uncharacterized membrane protein
VAQTTRPIVRRTPEETLARRRYRFRRRHTPHFNLVTTALCLATAVVVVDLIGFLVGTVQLGVVAFAFLAAACVSVLASYFWGFFMVMNGNIPMRRLKIFLPHAVVGSMSPLIYVLNISLAVDSVGAKSVSGVSLSFAAASLGILMLQYSMGRRVTRFEGLRLVESE